MDLDDPDAFGEIDPAGAVGATLAAPQRWESAPGLVGESRLPDGARAVIVAGMGASGVAGEVAAAAAFDRLDVPVVTVADATLPAWVGPATPVIAVSQSGDTEETLAVARGALDADARLVAVTAGGALADLAVSQGADLIRVPPGDRSRHALGSLAGAVGVYLGLGADIPATVVSQRTVVGALGPHAPTADNPAKQIAAAIAASTSVHVWSTSRLSAVAAVRLAGQLATDAKLPATTGALPDAAHHEVLGWHHAEPGQGERGLVVLRDLESETAPAVAQLGPALELAAPAFSWLTQRAVGAPGDPPLARLAALILAVDLVGVYAAIARDVDPTPVTALDHLQAAAAAD